MNVSHATTSVNPKVFSRALALVAKVAPKRSCKPILQANAVLSVGPDGAELSATDLDTGIIARFPCFGGETFSSLVPIPAAQKALKVSPADVDISPTGEGSGIAIEMGAGGRACVNASDPASNYPTVPRFECRSWYEVRASDVRRGIERTVYATDPESTRYAMGGVCLEFDRAAGEVRFVATDGRRLAMQAAPCQVGGDMAMPEHARCPILGIKAAKVLMDAVKAMGPDGVVRIATDGERVQAQAGLVDFYHRGIDGRFPRYIDAIPGSRDVRIALDAGELSGVFGQAAACADEDHRSVDCLAFPGAQGIASGLVVEVIKGDEIPYRRVIPAAVEGPARHVRMSASYALEMLKSLGKDPGPIAMDLTDDKSPIKFTMGDTLTCAIMPLTVDDGKVRRKPKAPMGPIGDAMMARQLGAAAPETVPTPETPAPIPDPAPEPPAEVAAPEPIPAAVPCHPSIPVGSEVGAKRWAQSGSRIDPYRQPWRGVLLAVDDPRAWEGSIPAEDVAAHVARCVAMGSTFARHLPVLWDFGTDGHKLYWDPSDDLRPYAKDLAEWRDATAPETTPEPTPSGDSREPADYTIADARYSKGNKAVSCPSPDGWKTRAARLAGHLKGRWSNREHAYIMSPSKARRLEALYSEGYDASDYDGSLIPPRACDPGPAPENLVYIGSPPWDGSAFVRIDPTPAGVFGETLPDFDPSALAAMAPICGGGAGG